MAVYEAEQWHPLGYIRYQILHHKWQAYLFELIQEVLAAVPGVTELMAELWQRYPKGLVAYLPEGAVPKVEKLAYYIAKYMVSLPMALSRLVSYDRRAAQARSGIGIVIIERGEKK